MKSSPTKRSGLSLTRVIVSLVSLGILFALWRTGQKWMVLPVGFLLLVGYLILPRLRASRVERFHRQALTLLAQGKAGEIPRLVKRSLFLQLVGPRSALDAKLGLAYVQTGQYVYALRYLGDALPHVSAEQRLPLKIALAKCYLVTGDFERAEAEAMDVQKRGTRLPEMNCIIARSRLKLNRLGEIKNLLKEAEGLSPSADVKWMIELIRAELSLKDSASCPNLPDADEPRETFLKSWRHFVLGQIWERNGNSATAQNHYREAGKLGQNTFVEVELGEKITNPPGIVPAGKSSSGKEAVSPPKKKRKKRR